MSELFLRKFKKYTPTPDERAVIDGITDFSVRVDKERRLVDMTVKFSEYVPYSKLCEIENAIAAAHECAGVRIRPSYADAGIRFTLDKMADVLSYFKRDSVFGNGFFAGAEVSFAAVGDGGDSVSIVSSDTFDEVASVSLESTDGTENAVIDIKLCNGGLSLLSAAGCGEKLSRIISDCFGENHTVTFSGKTSIAYEEYAAMAPTPPPITYIPPPPERERHSADGNRSGDSEKGEHIEQMNSLSSEAASAECNFDEGVVTSGRMKFDVNEPEPIHGTIKNFNVLPIREIKDGSNKFTICGEVFCLEKKLLKSGKKYLLTFFITDKDSSAVVKSIYDIEQDEEYSKLADGMCVALSGKAAYDDYDNCVVVRPNAIAAVKKIVRKDNAPVKRVELHLHTNMSSMDATGEPKDIIKQVKAWGQPAVAITDHGNLQAFPQTMLAAEKMGDVKVIYGIEAYFVDDTARAVYGDKDASFAESEFVVFDLETTGTSIRTCGITEIGAVKYRGGRIYDTFNTFVNPEMPIPEKITEITGITDDMVKDAPTIDKALPMFLEYAKDAILVAHNASFDVGFLRNFAEKLHIPFSPTYIDTVAVSRYVNADLKSHKLDAVARYFDLGDFNHHRASDDAHMLALIFGKMIEKLASEGLFSVSETVGVMAQKTDPKKLPTFHQIILVKNLVGLKNLYRMVSQSYLDFYQRFPRIPKTVLTQYREGLIIGSACEAGELFRAILEGKPESEVKEIASYYDYLEIQPDGNNAFLIAGGTLADNEALHDINRKIISLGEELGKPVVATGDVHFINPEDEIYRQILLAAKKMPDADKHIPLYMRTTEEMLEEFAYLGEEKAYEVVVTNTRLIADMIEEVRPIPKGNYPPSMEGAEEELSHDCYTKAKSMYGDPLPTIVEERLKKELTSIIKNGFAPLYVIARRLIKFSEDRGYQVGSRGSVGSSFAATMGGITEVNPLPPHYRCEKCKHSEFINDGSVGSGFDLPEKNCPNCGIPMKHDGHDIPFETFLGFNGDKSPDIDLNFSGDVQGEAHKYTEVLFGEGHVFRAGTLGTLAEKTAYGFVKKYCEEKGIVLNKAEETRLSKGCEGVKRTTGQHPGGIIVVPKEYSVYDFTPVQHPADDVKSGTVTTHFAFEYLHDTILKLDLLGHDVPTKYRMMEKYGKLNILDIPLSDPDVMELFLSTKSLGVKPEDIGSEVGTFGLPEFGTKFVRQMLVDSKPKNFTDLLQISGLSHGTDVWLGNAQELIKNGVCTISDVIGTRDSIMVYLIYHNLDRSMSFKIMEDVRKGRGLKPEYEEAMLAHDVPQWYIDSCKKIKYMFPKAHAAAYVISSLRLGWMKVHMPLEFYSAFLTVAPGGFDAEIVGKGKKFIEQTMKEIEEKGRDASQKEAELLSTLQLVNEACARKIQFLPVDLYRSKAFAFLPEDGAIRMPFSSLGGLGDVAAQSIEDTAANGRFLSVEDLRTRAQLSRGVLDILRANGVLDTLSETNQISMF